MDDELDPSRSRADLVAAITADRLVEHLRRAGFVLVRARPARSHSTG